MGRKNKKKIPEGPCTPFCIHFPDCGGCLYQQFSYEGQKEEKLSKVQKLLGEVCAEAVPNECLSSPRQTGYRNKMEFSFGDMVKDGPLTLGLHQRGSFYNIIPISDCQIVDSDYRAIIWATMQYFREAGLKYVHKKTHEGILRHLLVRKSVATEEIMVALVTGSDECFENGVYKHTNWADEWAKRLLMLDLYGRISGVLHIINDSLADVVQSDHTEVLYGSDQITEKLLGLEFKITPFSFFQTNSTGAEVLYSVVRDYIGEIDGMTVFDLYSGTGTIAQLLAPVAKKVIGVEIVKEAVEAARENAILNGLDNCEFIAGDVLKVMDEIAEIPDVMILDPPREGIHPKALPRLLSYGVGHFVYVSCKPDSLAKDLVPILEAGYHPVKSVCVDMFPWTKHIETVCLFEK